MREGENIVKDDEEENKSEREVYEKEERKKKKALQTANKQEERKNCNSGLGKSMHHKQQRNPQKVCITYNKEMRKNYYPGPH